MSKLGKKMINAIKDAKKNGLITLETTPDVALLRKKATPFSAYIQRLDKKL
jgi:hypothetical protein